MLPNHPINKPTLFLLLFLFIVTGCKKSSVEEVAKDSSLSFTVNGSYNGTLTYKNLIGSPVIKVTSSEPLNTSSLNIIIWKANDGTVVNLNTTLSSDGKSIEITPKA